MATWPEAENRKLHKEIPAISASRAIVIGKIPESIGPGDVAYMPGDKSYSQTQFVTLQLGAQEPSAQFQETDYLFTARFHVPVCCIGSQNLTLDSYIEDWWVAPGGVSGGRSLLDNRLASRLPVS